MHFDFFVGIDYSGADTSTSRLKGLQCYISECGTPEPVSHSPHPDAAKHVNWCRQELAEQLIAWVIAGRTYLAGIDHGFGFPQSYHERYGLTTWPHFLDDFAQHWPTDRDGVTVESLRQTKPSRMGATTDYRLTETWTSSAKSVFLFDVQGSVAKSTFAGLTWLRHVRKETKGRVHVWPFDGWAIPPGKCVLAEIYPSLVRRRYPTHNRTADQHDAYSIARWLAEREQRDRLAGYFTPPLTAEEQRIAALEGWILGVM